MADKNITPCTCCGQLRPYPREPGKWRYRHSHRESWYNVTVKRDDEGLTMTYEGKTTPDWWPENTQWEQYNW